MFRNNRIYILFRETITDESIFYCPSSAFSCVHRAKALLAKTLTTESFLSRMTTRTIIEISIFVNKFTINRMP